ncbi:MAG: RDD family protein [Candidatus Endonucleobacter bathymodioli]|uniref:RDD family protein n=1 Tax=Candidatus Endonucleibacter bathymodioli TaxID=539814 RepID=A0AA90SDC0_9GAMM|nr:RDD family protein [Candidatus Endonucleobacter bathymodioli]
MTSNAQSMPSLPAPLWRRLAAMAYDALLVIAIMIAVGFVNLGIQMAIYGASQLRKMTDQGYTLDNLFLYLTAIVVMLAFFGICWRKKGQTPGMLAWRIYIINENQQPITLTQTIIRCLVAIPAIIFGLLGVIWMKIDSEQKSWQDKMSGTRTVLFYSSIPIVGGVSSRQTKLRKLTSRK